MIDELLKIKKRIEKLDVSLLYPIQVEEVLHGLQYEFKRLLEILIREEELKLGDGK